MAPRETENNAYAKFWGDKQRTLWYVTVFLEWSITSLLHGLYSSTVTGKKPPLLTDILLRKLFPFFFLVKES